MRKTAIVVTAVLLGLTFAGNATAATGPAKQKTSAIKHLLVWLQGKLIIPVPSPEPAAAPADQTRQGS